MTSDSSSQGAVKAAHLETTVYTALYGYVQVYAPQRVDMVYVPEKLSAEEWLATARRFADQLRSEFGEDVRAAIDRVIELIGAEDYPGAQDYTLAINEQCRSRLHQARATNR